MALVSNLQKGVYTQKMLALAEAVEAITDHPGFAVDLLSALIDDIETNEELQHEAKLIRARREEQK